MTGFPGALLLAAAVFHPHIPRTWEDASVLTLEVPLANPKFSPIHISEAEYYRLPERTIYRSYPLANEVTRPIGASWQAVSVTSNDRTVLRGWLFRPSVWNGRAAGFFMGGNGGARV